MCEENECLECLNLELSETRKANAALQERLTKLEAAIEAAQIELQATQINWQEDCLFDCNDILTAALKGKE